MGMLNQTQFIPTSPSPQSLCWHGDELVDWVAGGARYTLDGKETPSGMLLGYRFDSAVESPDGRFVVVYEALGTAGLLLKDGRILRELHRSSYHADSFEYPVALTTLPSGRTLLAHCPDEYCKLELEDADTGQRLTERANDPVDFFHSRLQFSRDGRYLVSAGWLWHPLDAVWLVDVQRAIEDPSSLDRNDLPDFVEWGVEISAAVFGERDTLLVTSRDEFPDELSDALKGPPSSAGGPPGARISRYSIGDRRMVQTAPLSEPLGTLMDAGPHAVGFYGSPKLIDLGTGEVVARWPELSSGEQVSSIRTGARVLPPLALDPVRRRFALGTPAGIQVVQLAGG